jgi:hypothetical protein
VANISINGANLRPTLPKRKGSTRSHCPTTGHVPNSYSHVVYHVFLHYSVFIVSIFVLTDSWPFKMGRIRCSETSLMNCNYSLRNNLEDSSSRLLLGGSLKSRISCDSCVMSVRGNVVTSCEIADRLRKQSGCLNGVAEGAKTTYR